MDIIGLNKKKFLTVMALCSNINDGISILRKGGRNMFGKDNNSNYAIAIVKRNKNILNCNPALLVA